MSVKVANHALTEDYDLEARGKYGLQKITLPKGSFVKPIYYGYLPKHVIDAHPYFNDKLDIFVYSYYGIVVVPKKIVSER